MASVRLSSPDDRLEPHHLGSSLLVSDQVEEDEVVAKPSDRMARLYAKLNGGQEPGIACRGWHRNLLPVIMF